MEIPTICGYTPSSGLAFNLAVTFALWLIGNLTARRATGIVIAQLLGAIAAAGTSMGLTLGAFSVENSLADGLSSGKGQPAHSVHRQRLL